MKTKLILSLSIIIVLIFGLKNYVNAQERPPGGQMGVCYAVGETVALFTYTIIDRWGSTITIGIRDEYIGNCTIIRWYSEFETGDSGYWPYPGGCCTGAIPAYNQISYPVTSFDLIESQDTTNISIKTDIPLSNLEVWQLVDSGQVVFSLNDSLAADQIALIPRNVFANGSKYIIVGYTMLNNADAFMSLTINQNVITELLRFSSWQPPDSLNIIGVTTTYVTDDSVMVYIQHPDKSGMIVKGTHGAISTGIEHEENNIPNSFILSQNYPNPFNPSTVISFSVPAASYITLKVYDALGNEITTLINEQKAAGIYEVEFDAIGLSSGTYFYKLQSGSFVETKKMILLR